MRETGQLEHLLRMTQQYKPECPGPNDRESGASLSIIKLATAFMIVGLGSVLGIILLGFEKYISNKKDLVLSHEQERRNLISQFLMKAISDIANLNLNQGQIINNHLDAWIDELKRLRSFQ